MEDPRVVARSRLQHRDTSIFNLWILYRGNGGNLSMKEFEDAVWGLQEPDPFELTVLDWALEEGGAAD